MKLIEALEICRRPARADVDPVSFWLACGFEPLHLRTFLAAELIQRCGGAAVEIATGTFDDLIGNLELAASSEAEAIVVVTEWADIDPRLGLRRLGGWSVDDLADVVTEAAAALERLGAAVERAAGSRRVVCAMPTLPLPPAFAPAPRQSSSQELQLRGLEAALTARLSLHPGVVVLGQAQLDLVSPAGDRRDVKSELAAGFPFTLPHASALASQLACLLIEPPPKKGLITDLDDTLWAGVLDEAGPDGVSWDLEAHRHGLYQQFIASLASTGVLIGVVSRNDPQLAAEALARPDLLIRPDRLFPQEIGWAAKSESVARILRAWNLGAGEVVFVDDLAIERDEVREAHPGITTAALPTDDDGLLPFLADLRTWFGRPGTTAEDRLRAASIRSASAFNSEAASIDGDAFLAGVGGVVTFADLPDTTPRAIELLTKTNQFNLNARRWTFGALSSALLDGGRLVTVAYADRYGPLGTIAAVVVRPLGDELRVDAWALSCRAFARRIEHHTLHHLFDHFGAQTVKLAYEPTARNTAVRSFLASFVEMTPSVPVPLDRENLALLTPHLVHRVVESVP